MTGDSLPDEDDPGVPAAALDEELDEEDEEDEEEEDEAMALMVSKTLQFSPIKTRHKPLLVRTHGCPMNALADPHLP